MTGDDGTVYTYRVQWSTLYPVAELAPERLQAIVGPTDTPALTLMACGGAFDEATGEYLARLVARAGRVA